MARSEFFPVSVPVPVHETSCDKVPIGVHGSALHRFEEVAVVLRRPPRAPLGIRERRDL